MEAKKPAATAARSVPKRHAGWPSPEQFHEILKQIAPDESMTFTEAAVVGLRSAFLAYLDMVGSSLTEHDSLKEEETVVNALAINPKFEGFVRQAKEIIEKSGPPAKKRGKRKKKMVITPEMEAEQERLLQQSREAAINKKQKTEK
jgi:hypothetical protein